MVWCSYMLMSYFVMVCLSTILRRQWVDHERFSFPLVRLPVEMVENADSKTRLNSFLLNRTMWIGAGLAMILHIINGLNAHVPSVPQIPLYGNRRINHIERGVTCRTDHPRPEARG